MERELCRQGGTQNYPARYNPTTKGQHDFKMDKDRYFSKKMHANCQYSTRKDV